MVKPIFKKEMMVWSISNGLTLTQKKVNIRSFPEINEIIHYYGKGKTGFGENVKIDFLYSPKPIGNSEKTTLSVIMPSSKICIANHMGILTCTIAERKK